MSRFESPGHMVLFFLGAAIVSVFLILLLTAEARSRQIKEPEIDNETLFTVLGRKIFQLVQQWNRSEEPQVIRAGRSLQSIVTVAADDEEEPHPVRHRGRHNRVHRSSTPSPPKSGSVKTKKNTPRLLAAPHDTCYSTHEVLFIIGLTCVVNFAFVFIIMAMVHVCNKKVSSSSSCKSTGLTGLDSLDVPEECLATGRLITRSASCNGVQEYINNLPPPRSPSMSPTSPQMQASYSMEDLLYAG